MRRFNPEKELYKIQHGNKNKIIFGVIALLLIISIGSTYALYQVRYSKRIIYTKVAPFSNNYDIDLAVYVNGERQNKVVEKDSGYMFLTMNCDTPYEGTINWDDAKALLLFNQLQITIPNKCNVYLADNNYDGIKTFEYSGDVQEYTIPKDGLYKIELWGAKGGGNGGKGGYTAGNIELAEGEKLYFYVGALGTTTGAYNGGSAGGSGNSGGWSGGGGATDVRLTGGTWNDFNSLKSRIMVAGGGGGSSFNVAGMYGGFLSGSGASGVSGGGGSQTSGGTGGISSSFPGNNGQFGIGGRSNTCCSVGGAGGGYYGGGGGAHISPLTCGSGGGGSSFISGHPGCDAIKNEESTALNNIVHSGQPNHYSGKVFTNMIMLSGNDSIPNYNGGVMTGNAGDGYARITYAGPSE